MVLALCVLLVRLVWVLLALALLGGYVVALCLVVYCVVLRGVWALVWFGLVGCLRFFVLEFDGLVL